MPSYVEAKKIDGASLIAPIVISILLTAVSLLACLSNTRPGHISETMTDTNDTSGAR